jgi:GR25 family glycosyltransferase involved in LPS biosynthesis
MIDKVYLINLKHRNDRLIKIDKILKKIGDKFSEYEIFDAVNGKLITEEEKNNLLSLRSRRIFNNPSSFKDIRTLGAIGCYKSHIGVWELALERGEKEIIILEDDIILNVEVNKLKEYINTRPDNYDICYLDWYGLYGYDNTIEYNSNWNRNNGDEISYFSAYMISEKGIKKLLKGIYPIEQQIDCYADAYAIENKDFKRYLSKEIIFNQGYSPLYDSDITKNTFRCYLNDIILTKRFGKIILNTIIVISSIWYLYKYIKS